ncbi:MAG: nuclear transport factor 2 family protein [Myxococcota bacterium]|nr:nuclear transport factor 2 family protein [bacterium]MDP6074251.1 nuclear transport factor 2 family protein [Myxococcota bacterium]MDP7075847.1 nuclear transport factor 2 family protein [Myxococcota bacterium]MDP7298597.1 nuclear transport factor 2 family protein [Myxococcota bacterium]MDP7432970.1 nuclear transport factor 2 family protein [Myxococcota bacterium]
MTSASSEMGVRELADREAIRDLARRYAHHMWRKEVAETTELFTEDGEMDTGDAPVLRGRTAILEAYQGALEDSQFHPFVHNHIVELRGDEATGTCYLDLRATMEGRSMIGSGYYDDRYTRVDGAWKFRSRRLTMCYLVPIDRGWVESSDGS